MPVYAGKAAGSFGALGGEIIFDWVPDPNVVAGEIMRLAGYLENFLPPLEASKGIAKVDMEMHFDTESSPEGEGWAPLDPDYAIKRGSAHPILQLSGDMHDAAVSDDAYMIDAHDLFFDTSGLPFYWQWHETGTGEGGEAASWRERVRSKTLEKGAGGARESLGIGRGKAMPARPFVGISFAAQLTIIEAFDAWFDGAVSGFYTRPSGRVQRRMPGGQFGSMVGG